MKPLTLLGPAFALLLAGASCNIFDPLDAPTGDAQILSAARACFDRGELTCAREFYGKLSGTSSAEVAASELAFAILDEQGISMNVFLSAFASGGSGSSITTLANKILESGAANPTRRQVIFTAYKKHSEITSNAKLKGLVRFVSSAALLAEVLAEGAGADGVATFSKSDLAANASACKNSATSTCAADVTNCIVPTGSNVVGNYTATTNIESLTSINGQTADLNLIMGLVDEMDTALSAELGASGSFGSGAGSLASSIDAAGGNGSACIRQAILKQGIGE